MWNAFSLINSICYIRTKAFTSYTKGETSASIVRFSAFSSFKTSTKLSSGQIILFCSESTKSQPWALECGWFFHAHILVTFFVYQCTPFYDGLGRQTEIKTCILLEHRLVRGDDKTQETRQNRSLDPWYPSTSHSKGLTLQISSPSPTYLLFTPSSSIAACHNHCSILHVSTLFPTEFGVHMSITLLNRAHSPTIPHDIWVAFTREGYATTSVRIRCTRYILHHASIDTNHSTFTRSHESAQMIPNPTTYSRSTPISDLTMAAIWEEHGNAVDDQFRERCAEYKFERKRKDERLALTMERMQDGGMEIVQWV